MWGAAARSGALRRGLTSLTAAPRTAAARSQAYVAAASRRAAFSSPVRILSVVDCSQRAALSTSSHGEDAAASARARDGGVAAPAGEEEETEGTLGRRRSESAANGVEDEHRRPSDQGKETGDAEVDGAEQPADSLEERVRDLEAQVKEMSEARLRLLAEMQNVRNIAKRDVDNAKTYAIGKFAKSLLDVADNLNRALGSVPSDELDKDDNRLLRLLHDGVRATDSELRKTLAAQDIQEFGEAGDIFDPNRHEAMFQAPNPDFGPGQVSQVLKTGFTFRDRILRPAQVGIVPEQ